MIILPIKKRWYDMILSGKKREEYREIKPYWQVRFKKVFQMDPVTDTPTGQDAHIVMFRNGYRRASPFIRALCTLSIKTGRKEWGAEPGKDYLVLTIRDILSRDSAEKEERDGYRRDDVDGVKGGRTGLQDRADAGRAGLPDHSVKGVDKDHTVRRREGPWKIRS